MQSTSYTTFGKEHDGAGGLLGYAGDGGEEDEVEDEDEDERDALGSVKKGEEGTYCAVGCNFTNTDLYRGVPSLSRRSV